MAGLIEIEIKDEEIRKLLTTMRKRTLNARSLMTLFYVKVNFEVDLNFRLQSAPPDIFSGPPGNVRTTWKPLSAYSIARGRTGAVLQDTGALRGSMGKVRIITNNSMTYGTPSTLSAVHHFGATIKPVRAKFLALPFPGIVGRPRDYKNAFFLGRTLFQNTGDGGLKALFFLKDQIVIPARPHMTISEKLLLDLRKLTFNFLTKNTGGTASA